MNPTKTAWDTKKETMKWDPKLETMKWDPKHDLSRTIDGTQNKYNTMKS